MHALAVKGRSLCMFICVLLNFCFFHVNAERVLRLKHYNHNLIITSHIILNDQDHPLHLLFSLSFIFIDLQVEIPEKAWTDKY